MAAAGPVGAAWAWGCGPYAWGLGGPVARGTHSIRPGARETSRHLPSYEARMSVAPDPAPVLAIHSPTARSARPMDGSDRLQRSA